MSKSTKNSLRSGARRVTTPSRYGHLQTHRVGLAASLALTLCGFAVFAQEPRNVGTSHNWEQTIAETRNRVPFDGDALFNGPIPYWSDGYLITRKTESFSATTPNVALFGRNGSKSIEVAFWFPGSQRVVIASAAVSHYGGILASGEADKGDGTRAPFIAFANLKGQVTSVIQTGDFFPRNICEAPDDSIWAFGGMRPNASQHEPLPGNVLRRFDLQKGETASYVPRSTFPSRMQADALSYIRCSGDAVIAYSNPAKALIELSYRAEAPRIYHISVPEGLEVVGLAVTNSGLVYGGLDDLNGGNGKEGMYTLVLDRGADTGHWQPVKGAVGNLSDEGVVSRVWGVDGDSLVVSRGGDPTEITALHWVVMSQK
jgi:hypothetical protein